MVEEVQRGRRGRDLSIEVAAEAEGQDSWWRCQQCHMQDLMSKGRRRKWSSRRLGSAVNCWRRGRLWCRALSKVGQGENREIINDKVVVTFRMRSQHRRWGCSRVSKMKVRSGGGGCVRVEVLGVWGRWVRCGWKKERKKMERVVVGEVRFWVRVRRKKIMISNSSWFFFKRP